jgi:hypothetical protein
MMGNITAAMTRQDLLRIKERAQNLPLTQRLSFHSLKRMKSEKKRNRLATGVDLLDFASPVFLDINNMNLQTLLRRAFGDPC